MVDVGGDDGVEGEDVLIGSVSEGQGGGAEVSEAGIEADKGRREEDVTDAARADQNRVDAAEAPGGCARAELAQVHKLLSYAQKKLHLLTTTLYWMITY